jgi:transposase
MDCIEHLTRQIAILDKRIEERASKYPELESLQQIKGVGPTTSLAFVLTLEDPSRFANGRAVGKYLGLTPARRKSGDADPQMRISKAGDPYLRQLLVSCAHYIMGPHGPDTELRRWGLELAARGGKNGKKRAAVAVARKLAGILYRLWVSGEDYHPFHHSKREAATEVSDAGAPAERARRSGVPRDDDRVKGKLAALVACGDP